MNQKRMELYGELEKRIGRTPLVKFLGEVPNENAIYIKRECDNPFGSHYDRVYLELFRHHEDSGNIQPGNKVLETTTGAAGVSFAGIGKKLGYDCYVALPAGGEKAREDAIKQQLPSEDHLILTPAEHYVSGFPNFLKRFLVRNKDYFFLNHSMGPMDKHTGRYTNNEITLMALEVIADEVMREKIEIAYFVPAVGNGSSVLGPARVFKKIDEILYGAIGGIWEEPSSFGGVAMKDLQDTADYIDSVRTKTIAFETVQSAVAFDQLHPGEYEKRFSIKPGTLSRHRLPGTSYQGINFPHIKNSIEGRIIDEVILVSDSKMDEEYQRLTGMADTRQLPHWDVHFAGHKDLGRSTRAGISVALDIAKRAKGKNILVIGYDKAERYDN
ncbi:pyridoxal-phosphate dependent enzyme [Candidatus Woesearchaeota archaeon]|nr:pyridoxal-phosphate dependent enzyme [Candidatus Woesearchaeota archaeon]